MFPTKVRIVRKRKSSFHAANGWLSFWLMVAKLVWSPWIDERKGVMADVQLEVRRTQAMVNHQRAAAVSNDVVIKDLKIEQLKLQNELLKRKVKMLGGSADDFAPPSNY